MSKKVVILLGLPGSGKGTQGAVLSHKLALSHISTGDIFRKLIADNGDDSKLLSSYMNEGKLAPTDLVNKLVGKFISSDECKDGCILDGYPRNTSQAEYFRNHVDADIVVIFFDLDEEIVVKRILGRYSCAVCSKLYNKYFSNPKVKNICDDCGATEFIVRSDDDKQTVLARIKEYKKETLPLVEYYKQKGKFFTVDAAGSKEDITKEVSLIVKSI